MNGNLKEVATNLNNSDKSRIEVNSKPLITSGFAPLKKKASAMEHGRVEKNDESEEFKLIHTRMTQKLIENFDNEPELFDCSSNKKSEDRNGEDNEMMRHAKSQSDVPPKPLPRKSISEQGSLEENGTQLTLPKPRPRTTGQNITYKVESFYILRVFCV